MLRYNTVSACHPHCFCPTADLGDCICNCIGSEEESHNTTIDTDYNTTIDTAQNIINWGLLSILLIGLILGTYLIYRKHKGEKGLGKKVFKWNLIYIFIIFVLFIGVSLLFWYIKGPFADFQSIPFEN